MIGQVGTENKLFWYGGPTHVPKLNDRGGILAADMKHLQGVAYEQLSLLLKHKTQHIDFLTKLMVGVVAQGVNQTYKKTWTDVRRVASLTECCATHNNVQ
ncbi:MAG: hypothetical protein ACKPKO_44850, partial [Candidatus Fonsibacter sp.]